MARSKVDHSKNISSRQSVRGAGSVKPGDILLFKYKGKDVYDKTPMIMILNKESKIIRQKTALFIIMNNFFKNSVTKYLGIFF